MSHFVETLSHLKSEQQEQEEEHEMVKTKKPPLREGPNCPISDPIRPNDKI